MSLNRVVLVGRLTKDPELRFTPNGVAVATFTLAVNRTYTNQEGEREADFINCIVWRRPAENVANFLKKGSLAGVDGRIQTRSYENNDGKRVYVTEVVAESVQFLESRGENQGNQGNHSQNSQGGNNHSNRGNQGGQNNRGRSNQNQGNNYGGNQNQFNTDPFANDGQPVDISDDDLPF